MSALLDALGYAGDLLDKPGRAVRGLLSGRPDELASFLPFSDTLGLTSQDNRASGEDVLQHQFGVDGGMLGGMATEIATDPLALFGGLAGRVLGGRASAAAAARGPRYGTTADDIQRMARDLDTGGTMGRVKDTNAAWRDVPNQTTGGVKDTLERWVNPAEERRVDDFFTHPIKHDAPDPTAISRVLSEIHPDSKMVGSGVEAITFRSPSGEVVRVAQNPGDAGRPLTDWMARPNSTTDIGDRFRVERVPFAENIGDKAFWKTRNPNTMTTRMDDLHQAVRKDGVKFPDDHLGNVGTIGGKPQVIDPGAFRGEYSGATAPITAARDPGYLMHALLNGIGSDDAVRRAYAAGASGPNFRNKLSLYGALTGSDAGTLSRMGVE